MSYCLAILTRDGIVFAADSRTNAGLDQSNTCRKLHVLGRPGDRAFVLLASGGLSLSQSVLTLLERDFARGEGLAAAGSVYDAARCAGEAVRRVADLDRPSLERDHIPFNVHLLVGGQVKGGAPDLYLVYPQGNPLRATPDSPYLQIGEIKYGRPILDRAVRYESTTLEQAVKLALISLDSTMRSNMTVGPPVDVAVYGADELRLTRRLRLPADDPRLVAVRTQWERELRDAAHRLPAVRFD